MSAATAALDTSSAGVASELLQLAAQRLAAEIELQTAELLAAYPPRPQAKQLSQQRKQQPQQPPQQQPQPQPQQQQQQQQQVEGGQPPQQQPRDGKKAKPPKKCRDWGKCKRKNCKFRHPEGWTPQIGPKKAAGLKVQQGQQHSQQQDQQQQGAKTKNKQNDGTKQSQKPHAEAISSAATGTGAVAKRTDVDDHAVPRQGKYWWRKLKGTDPITLERLSRRPYPPFILASSGASSSTTSNGAVSQQPHEQKRGARGEKAIAVEHFFDGKVSESRTCMPLSVQAQFCNV
eukprot:COSAG02_NODE_2271_length_9264_cov_2.764539_2_plen_288_part_00